MVSEKNKIDFRFPHDIGNKEYENRCMRITVMELPPADPDHVKALSASIKKKAKEANYEDIKSVVTADLDEMIDKAKRTFDEFKKMINSIPKALLHISLPLPNEFNDVSQHEWTASKGVAGSISETFYDGGKIAKGVSVLADTLNVRKPLADPSYYQDYSGTQPRTFNFSWDLIPNNPDEAKEMISIIRLLKKYSSPTHNMTNMLINTPHYFKFSLKNKYFNDTLKLKEAVITNIDVNYSADGNMQLYHDGIPKFIKLSISVSEKRAQYNEDY